MNKTTLTLDAHHSDNSKGQKKLADTNIKKAFSALTKIRQSVDEVSSDYKHSTAITSYKAGGKDVHIDLRDMLIIGAITELDVLITGRTGCGKTRIANGVLEALFGRDDVYSKTILPNMSAQDFLDIDFPAIIEGRKTLQEAVGGIKVLLKPGIVLNEVNRAPGILQNILIPFLDRELDLQGVTVEMGKSWTGGRYQFRILTINEGGDYQVHELDRAIRDRMTIEIPLDRFPPTRKDVLSMLTGEQAMEMCSSSDDNFQLVTWLNTVTHDIALSPLANRFLCYLSGLSYCIRAPMGTKESVNFSPEVLCEGCHHYGHMQNICGNILAPSGRILLQLSKVAKAFALFRCWKTGTGDNVMAQPVDVVAAAPFVFYSKLHLNPQWVANAGTSQMPFNGDRFTAIREVLKWTYLKRFLPLQKQGTVLFDIIWGEEENLTREHYQRLHDFILDHDPWVYNPAQVRKKLWELKKEEGS